MKSKWGVGIGVLGLVLIRFWESALFYDPLRAFFHQPEYMNLPLPSIDLWCFSWHLLLRFLLNLGCGLLIVYAWWGNRALTQLTAIIIGFLGIALMPQVIYLAISAESSLYGWLFYTRRMVIHPLLIIILLPAFLFYQKEKSSADD